MAIAVPPFRVREIEHTWIPLSDGTRLSARVWLPEGAGPVPAVVEYIPYRKRDDTRWRDEPMHGFFAGQGYASVRIDVRGSGTSEGVLSDEYAEEEWRDGLEALRWVAAQPWCDGGVGLMGKSWGGINALQIAALRPPELRCVITVCSTDDRWATDAHWMGGCLLGENLTWGAVLQTLAMRPEDPALVGESWRESWIRRMSEAPLYVARWLRHSTRDAYWARGSTCEDYGRIQVPVLAVSGWADAYADTVPRLLAGLRSPVRGWVGPWAHVYPHNAVPGPAAGFLRVALGWWSTWLGGAGEATAAGGVRPPAIPEPFFRAWINEGGGRPWEEAERRGRWVGEHAWPSLRIGVRERGWPDRRGPLPVPWTGTGGLAAGAWCPFELGDLPGDQGPDDDASVLLDLPPLAERLEVLGAPEVEVELTCDRRAGMVAVRLCDVAPDGTSIRVTYGLLDLSFRDGFRSRRPLEPGRRYRVRVPLRACGHAFPRGHRVRVAVSSSYWPLAWPATEPFRLEIFPEGCVLRLPERRPAPLDPAPPPLPPPEGRPEPAREPPGGSPSTRVLARDDATGEFTLTVRQGWGPGGEPSLERIRAIGLESGWGIEEEFRIHPHHPASARATVRHVVVSRRAGWSTRLELRMLQERRPGGWWVRGEVVGHEGGREIHRRILEEEVPEDADTDGSGGAPHTG